MDLKGHRRLLQRERACWASCRWCPSASAAFVVSDLIARSLLRSRPLAIVLRRFPVLILRRSAAARPHRRQVGRSDCSSGHRRQWQEYSSALRVEDSCSVVISQDRVWRRVRPSRSEGIWRVEGWLRDLGAAMWACPVRAGGLLKSVWTGQRLNEHCDGSEPYYNAAPVPVPGGVVDALVELFGSLLRAVAGVAIATAALCVW